jgi:hypothetical protein
MCVNGKSAHQDSLIFTGAQNFEYRDRKFPLPHDPLDRFSHPEKLSHLAGKGFVAVDYYLP